MEDDSTKFISLFRFWSLRILVCLVLVESIVFLDSINILGCFYALYGWSLILIFVLKPEIIQRHPLPSIIVIGYGLCSFYLPLPATLLEGKPITFNLDVPQAVFFQGMIAITATVAAFRLYISLYNLNWNKPSRLRVFLTRLNLYTPPTDFQMWIMGVLGLFCIYKMSAGAHLEDDSGSLTSRFLQGFFPLAYCPYYILMKDIYSVGGRKVVKKVNWIFVIYSILILVVAFMTNHRSTFMKVIMGLGFVYFLGLLLNRFSYRVFTPKKILLYGLLFWLLTGPLMDIGLAMVTVRGQKHNITASELVNETIDVFFDKELLAMEKKLWDGTIVNNIWWDEHYLDNIFLGRLCNLKASDLSLFHADRIEDKSKMRSFIRDFSFGLLPSPLLNGLGIKIDKEVINTASYGDFLYYYSTGDYYGLESKRQAHLEGAGLGTFGYLYLVILVFLLIILFSLMDLLVFYKENKTLITIPALTIMPMLFTFFNYEGLSTFIGFTIRGWIQLIFLYVIVFKVTIFITTIFNEKQQKY